MILATTTIWPLWATYTLWSDIAPTALSWRRFSFSTVAYRAMQQSVVSWKRGESRRRQAEEAYCALYGRRETVCDAELPEAYFFSELQKCGTPQQAAFALLRLHGYSIAEIAARYKLDPRRVRPDAQKSVFRLSAVPRRWEEATK